MSSTLKHLNTGQRRFKDAEGMYVTRYDSSGLLEETTFDIHDIVGDTLSITMDDPDKTEVPWEFGDTNLDENIKMGNMNFTCQCLDFQNDIMLNLFGCTNVNGAIAFPSEYKDLYVMIRIKFADVDLVLPYVKMNAKATLENMRTDIARGELSGTIMSKEVFINVMPTAGSQTVPSGSDAFESSVDTPMLYLPNGSTGGKAAYVYGKGTSLPTTKIFYTDVHADATTSGGGGDGED